MAGDDARQRQSCLRRRALETDKPYCACSGREAGLCAQGGCHEPRGPVLGVAFRFNWMRNDLELESDLGEISVLVIMTLSSTRLTGTLFSFYYSL